MVLKNRNIAIKKGNTIAFLSLKYRLFQKPLEAFICKGYGCFSDGILLILLFFPTPTDFRIYLLGGWWAGSRPSVCKRVFVCSHPLYASTWFTLRSMGMCQVITPRLRQTKKKSLIIKDFLHCAGAPRETRTPTSCENGF